MYYHMAMRSKKIPNQPPTAKETVKYFYAFAFEHA